MLINNKSFIKDKYPISILIGIIFFILLVGFVFSNANQDISECTLIRVVDGDTIMVNINDEQYKVRFLGVNAPESVNPNELANSPEGIAASNYLKSIIQPGQTLYLEKDIYQNDRDKYKRLLRYVWTENPANCKNFDNLLNYKMINNGFARVNYYGNNQSLYYSKLKEAEQNWDTSVDVEYIDAL